MKIITFQGGLGNQIFQYVYYLYLRKHYPDHAFYGFYPSRALKDHNGLEIDTWFDVELPETSFISNTIAYSLFWINKLFWRLRKPFLFTDTDWFRKQDAVFYSGFWQDKRYFLEMQAPAFKKDLCIGNENEMYLEKILGSNSVAVHIRRGDYTKSKGHRIYGGICTFDYYLKSIEEIKKRIANPKFFFFSDDTEYVENNFENIDKTIISCNKGENSFFDMYLMTHCKNMILANSTFSCWAAYLNKNNPVVICPHKWRNDKPSPPVILDNWIKI